VYQRRYWWMGLVASAAVAVTAGIFLVVHPISDAREAPAAPEVPVQTATVSVGDVPIELEALGHVEALNTVTIHPLVSGQIDSINFKDGQSVEKGALLVQLDPRPLQATVDQEQGIVRRDQASLDNAKVDLQRYIPLSQKGIISAQQVESQRSRVDQFSATLSADQAALSRDQVQLSYTSITAPIAGVLGLRLVDVGNVVSPSDPQKGLVVLTQIQPITVRFPLPQANLPDIQTHQSATAKTGGLTVEAWSSDGSRKLDKGSLAALSNQVDLSSGTVMLEGMFPNPNNLLWPGSSVLIRLVLDTQHNGLTVPIAAIDQGPSGPFVWVVAADSTVHTSPVKIEQALAGRVLVSSGLSTGQQVVVNGQYGLTAGAHVAVQQAAEQMAGNGTATIMHTNQPGRLGITQ
jgi:membrane fusion protein, multidrug efflux system